MEFLSYIAVLVRTGLWAWWQFVWTNLIFSGIVAAVVFLVGAFVHSRIIRRWPGLEEHLGEPTGQIATFLLYGCLAVILVAGATLLLFMTAAPASLHYAQQEIIRKQDAELKAKTNLLELRRPQLSGEILTVFSGMLHREGISADVPISAIWMILRNTGEPSIAENLEVWIKLPDGRRLRGEKAVFGPDASFSLGVDDNGAPHRVIGAADLLTRRATTPIQKGAAIYGYLVVGFNDATLADLTTAGVIFVVTFSDVYGNQYTTKYSTRGEGLWHTELPEGSTFYLPGES